MLTDQNFSPVPLIGIGPEVFYSSNPWNIEMSRLGRIREFQLDTPFVLCFIAMAKSPKYGNQVQYCEKLESLGVSFRLRLFFEPKAHDNTDLNNLFRTLTIVYSPELVELNLKSIKHRAPIVNCPFERFMETLENFSRVPQPFNRQAFNNYINR